MAYSQVINWKQVSTGTLTAGVTTYYSLHLQASIHCHTVVEEDQQVSWMPLDWLISAFCGVFRPRSTLTDVPPGISCFVYLHPGGDDVGGIAEKWQPHVFNVEIVECLPYCSVELVTLVNGISTMWATVSGELTVVYATIG